MSEPMVTITKSDYIDLLNDQTKLQCLEEAGVDNWNGYEYAIEAYEEIRLNGDDL